MYTRIIYVSDDGEEFETEEECLEYERSLNPTFIMLDCDLEKTEQFGDAMFLYLADEDDVKNMKAVAGYDGYDVDDISRPGMYVYIDEFERMNSSKGKIYIDLLDFLKALEKARDALLDECDKAWIQGGYKDDK